ncbi:hypothetical protein DRN44_03775 [Thermococci archaeon]|nr:MAG: hypothetical protein DRN44_03775 [Thermococci archaeon]
MNVVSKFKKFWLVELGVNHIYNSKILYDHKIRRELRRSPIWARLQDVINVSVVSKFKIIHS